ncbi:MAG: rod shape-determining protein MreC [Bacillota bacterium]|nr:rod shape-determining protein MreC [Bacillota bacterium]MDW7683317.1 rod shape-determining protein MreC [Bacillota bacterium]
MPVPPVRTRKKTISLLLFLVLLLGIGQLTAGRQNITVVEEVLLTVVAPVQGVFQRLTRSVESMFATVKNYQMLLEENARLNEQLAAALTLEARLAEVRRENDRLRLMLGFQERSQYDLIAAEVVARDPSDWFHTITINKGSLHGVERNMAVVTSEGLVGNVLTVSPLSAQVLLLTDPGRGVSALVQRSREPGEVSRGIVDNDPGRPGYLQIDRLPRDANIQPGDTVISSGLGGIFPKGLVIGYVLEVQDDDSGILTVARLRPATNFNRLEEVFVVIPSPPPEEIYKGGF